MRSSVRNALQVGCGGKHHRTALSGRYQPAIWLLFAAIGIAAPAGEDQTQEAMSFLEGRNASVGTCDLQIRQYHFDLAPDSYQAFRDGVAQLGAINAENTEVTDLAAGFAGKWSGKVSTMDIHILWRGKQFKETRTVKDQVSWTTAYDGELYRDYRTDNTQLDVYASVPPVLTIGPDEIGITNTKALTSAKAAKFVKNENGEECTLSLREDDSYSSMASYDQDFRLLHREGRNQGELSDEQWYLHSTTIDGYWVPRIKVSTSVSARGCSVTVYAVESAKINSRLTDADFAIGNLPPWTLVVDRRHNPPIQTRLIDTPEELLRDEVVFDEKALQPSSLRGTDDPPEPQREIDEPGQTMTQDTPGTRGDPHEGMPEGPSDANGTAAPALHGSLTMVAGLAVLAVAVLGSGLAVWRRRI